MKVSQSSKWKFEFTDRSKLLNLFLYSSKQTKNWKIYWYEQSFTGLGLEYRCSLWGLVTSLNVPCMDLYKDDKFVFSNYKLGSKLLHMNDVYWMTLFIVCFLADTLVHRLTENSVGKMLWWLSLKTLSLYWKETWLCCSLPLSSTKFFFSCFQDWGPYWKCGGKMFVLEILTLINPNCIYIWSFITKYAKHGHVSLRI